MLLFASDECDWTIEELFFPRSGLFFMVRLSSVEPASEIGKQRDRCEDTAAVYVMCGTVGRKNDVTIRGVSWPRKSTRRPPKV